MSQESVEACILDIPFSSLSEVANGQNKICFNTPDSFISDANFPARPGWIDLQRTMFMGTESLGADVVANTPSVTQQGVTVFARRIMAQNSLTDFKLDEPQKNLIQVFSTGDPASSSHWLKQIRIRVHKDDSGRMRSVSSDSRYSVPVQVTLTTYHDCDRRSCLGCRTIKLQALCYAAQQCAVVNCVGTVVNQNRPLCNIGLVAKSYAESTLSMMMGAWLIFTESYDKILDASLLGPQVCLCISEVSLDC